MKTKMIEGDRQGEQKLKLLKTSMTHQSSRHLKEAKEVEKIEEANSSMTISLLLTIFLRAYLRWACMRRLNQRKTRSTIKSMKN